MEKQHVTYLSLGSNQGDRTEFLQKAIDLIYRRAGDITAISSVYKTASWGFDSDFFHNIVLRLSTTLSSKHLLKEILEIENTLGRKRTENYDYENRNIDIDILLFDSEIIFSKELIIPHPRMLSRRFVLLPLEEISKKLIHPTEKQTIEFCLKNCNDTSEALKIDKKLTRPLSIFEKYNFIAIEGNIGAGKTTLANMIAKDFQAKLVLERFEENPFLPKFYTNNDEYAFQLEMSFLIDRFQQLSKDLTQFDLFKKFVVSDYYIFKSLIFAQITLKKGEYKLYRKMFNIMYNDTKKPDLYVYLHQSKERLIENIKKRGRAFEQSIHPDYLEKIQKGYINFINTEQQLNSLIINITEYDFASSKKDYRFVVDEIRNHNL